jgi:hypothetical protein
VRSPHNGTAFQPAMTESLMAAIRRTPVPSSDETDMRPKR